MLFDILIRLLFRLTFSHKVNVWSRLKVLCRDLAVDTPVNSTLISEARVEFHIVEIPDIFKSLRQGVLSADKLIVDIFDLLLKTLCQGSDLFPMLFSLLYNLLVPVFDLLLQRLDLGFEHRHLTIYASNCCIQLVELSQESWFGAIVRSKVKLE